MIGGHFTYAVDATELIPLTTGPSSRFKPDLRNTEESRFIGILNNLDLTRSFYYSYSYDITRTLQHNIMAEREAIAKGMPYPHDQDYNSMFVWNSYLLQPAVSALKNTYDWCMPVIHGYIDQSGMFNDLALSPSDSSSNFYIWSYSLYHHHCQAVAVFRWRPILEAWRK